MLLRFYVGEEHARPETLPGTQPDDQGLPSRRQFRTERASENGPLKYDESTGATRALRLEFARRACRFLESHFLTLQVEQPNASFGGGSDLLIPANDAGRSSVGPIFTILERLERSEISRRLSAEEMLDARVLLLEVWRGPRARSCYLSGQGTARLAFRK